METQNNMSEDMEVLKKKEDEHLRLQRQVRHIQADRHPSSGIKPQFRRQDQLLRTLKKEYINLVKDLKIARSGAHKKKDKKMKSELKKALLYRVQTEMECVGGLVVTDQLDGLLQRNNKHMRLLRKTVTDNTGQLKERNAQSENRLIRTENVLEAAMIRFNTIQCENKKIRMEIEHMLKDRILFNQSWIKMLTALNKGKKFLTDLFESSTLAYDQRDEWVNKLLSVQEKGKIDQSLQLQEMRDLQKAFDHEMKLFQFLARKGVQRVNNMVEEKEEKRKIKEEEHIKMQCHVHSQIIKEVTDYSKENLTNTIETFTKTEQQIFSIYELLTFCCAENEVLRRDLKKIKQDVDDRRDWMISNEAKHDATLERLRIQIEEKKKVTDILRSKVAEKDQKLSRSMDKIADIFKMLDCSLEPMQNLLGDKQPSSLWQMKLTICLITEKINQYVETVYYAERYLQRTVRNVKPTSRLKKYTVFMDYRGHFTALPINLMVPADTCPACVESRWLTRVSETPEVPMSKEMTLAAIEELYSDPVYVRSDHVHPITECRVPRSRIVLANRYAMS